MNDREKLVEIVCNAIQEVDCISHCNHPPCYKVHHVVDELISHGVTVKEPQKPLAVGKLEYRMKCWYEESGEDELDHVMIGGSGYAIELYFIKSPYPMEKLRWEYGKTWRCWAEKPTEEERKAAEWEK